VNLEKTRRERRESTLRVLFVSREYPPETGGGGIGSYVEAMARALVVRGHEVHVLSCVPGRRARTSFVQEYIFTDGVSTACCRRSGG
jgi:Starch synthase catalytic domain